MAEERIFVGRKDELEKFGKVLEDPKGQAVLVVGQAGMGKTWLVNKMTEVAENHPDLKCGWVRYEVTPTDSVDSTMALMMDNAFEAASTEPGSFDKVPQRRKQWMALLKTVVPKGGEIAELIESLRRDPQRNTREQLLKRLELVSERMPVNGRAVFIIDPEKYMQKESDYAWGLVVDRLPDKVKFLFAQRPEDVLVQGEGLDRCDNVIRIPEGELKRFDEKTIEELVSIQSERTPELEEEVRSSVKRSDKSPYAVTGTLELITGAGMKAEDLAQYLTTEEVAEAQWRGICERGDEAVRLFKAYSILEVAVPDDVVEAVSGLKSSKRRKLLADKYLRGLLREEESGRIYHAILADYIVGQIGEGERKEYHSRAVRVYREKLAEAEKTQTKPDELAVMRLAEHVLAAEGKEAFVDAFVNECTQPLLNLGLLDGAIALSERALSVVEKGSKEEAMVIGNLGLVYETRGELDKAEEMLKRALEIDEKLGLKEGKASDYGNLGVVYQKRGELDKAEEIHKKSLEIEKKLGRLEGMASDYGNLGLIYMDRGDLDKAEEMHKKSLEIENKLGRLEGMASDYGNLGNVYYIKGELDKAEEMYNKVLKIEEKLGRPDSIASAYGNLGLIYGQRGDIERAREYWEKTVELYKKIGMPHMVEKVEGWIRGLE